MRQCAQWGNANAPNGGNVNGLNGGNANGLNGAMAAGAALVLSSLPSQR